MKKVFIDNGDTDNTQGSQYWKFDPTSQPHVKTDQYPKSINLWGLPDNIDGALQWDNRRTYFFKVKVYIYQLYSKSQVFSSW